MSPRAFALPAGDYRFTTGFTPGYRKNSQIDKAFRIAKPMRKASWTKRFAAGWGERRAANGLLSLVRAVVGTWPPV